MAVIAITPLDRIRERWGQDLDKLANPAVAHKVMARAVNYEGRKAFTRVKRALVKQTSIPNPIVQRSMKFRPASTKGGAIEAAIVGRGSELSLKLFGPKQFKPGTRAKVWGRAQMFEHAFMGPRPGAIAPKLGGHVFHREGSSRLPIGKLYGPSVPKEMVKDQTAQEFYASCGMIVDRVGKELAAVMRGF